MQAGGRPGEYRNAAQRPADAAPALQVLDTPAALDAARWNALLARQPSPTPFMRHEYLLALHASGSAVPHTGWAPRFMLLWAGSELIAACPLYLKSHSFGEYVFDWAWANAHAEHGLPYYPKAVVAVPFTPVPGTRLLARDQAARAALIAAVRDWCADQRLSSLHLLFGDEADLAACEGAGLMRRSQVQFHWKNGAPPRSAAAPAALPPVGALAALGRPGDGEMVPPRSAAAPAALPPVGALAALGRPGGGEMVPPRSAAAPAALPPVGALAALGRPGGGSDAPAERPFADFDDFLAALTQDKRKKIRQERRRVAQAGVRFRWAAGNDITAEDWAFFYRCYRRTYLEHGNAPYLTPAFFAHMARHMADVWVLFTAERESRPIATSLIAVGARPESAGGSNDAYNGAVAYGRYWGALERVDGLHFEACYHQPLEWCIHHGVARFEGGAQGEHKMARALLPVATHSAHWLAHPGFADAVARFLARESLAVDGYLGQLGERSPFRRPDG